MENQKILFPCIICKLEYNTQPKEICSHCTQIIDQDYVYQRELPVDLEIIEALNDANFIGRTKKFAWYNPSRPKRLFGLEYMLLKARLSDPQKHILRKKLRDGKSFFSISQDLGILKKNVVKTYMRAIKKLKNGGPKLLWMREEDNSMAQARLPNSSDPLKAPLTPLTKK